jgi:hypothetical protein
MGRHSLEARPEKGQEPETANLSCDPTAAVESGEKPDEADASQSSQPAIVNQARHPT